MVWWPMSIQMAMLYGQLNAEKRRIVCNLLAYEISKGYFLI